MSIDLKELLEALKSLVDRPIFPFIIVSLLFFVISRKVEDTEVILEFGGTRLLARQTSLLMMYISAVVGIVIEAAVVLKQAWGRPPREKI